MFEEFRPEKSNSFGIFSQENSSRIPKLSTHSKWNSAQTSRLFLFSAVQRFHAESFKLFHWDTIDLLPSCFFLKIKYFNEKLIRSNYESTYPVFTNIFYDFFTAQNWKKNDKFSWTMYLVQLIEHPILRIPNILLFYFSSIFSIFHWK